MGVDALLVFLSRLLSRGSVFIVLLLLARTLSVEDLGFYGLVTTTAYTAVYFCSLGLRHASAFFLGKGFAEDGAVVAALVVSAVVLGIVSALFASGFYIVRGETSSTSLVALLSGAVLLPMLFVYIGQGYFLGKRQIKRFNFSELLSRFVLLAVVGGGTAASFGLSLELALLAFLLSNFVGMAYVVVIVFRSLDGPVQYSAGVRLIIPMIKQGFPFAVALALVLLSPTISLHSANYLLGAQAGGLFFAAYKITDIVGEAATATGLVSFSHGVQSSNARRALLRARRSAWVVSGLAVFFAIFMSLAADLLIPTLLGAAYSGSADLMSVLAWSLPFLCFARIMNPSLAAQGYGASGAWVQFATVLTNVALAFALAPSLGLVGIAVALAISRVLNAFAFAVVVARVTRVGFCAILFPDRRWLALTLGRLIQRCRVRMMRSG